MSDLAREVLNAVVFGADPGDLAEADFALPHHQRILREALALREAGGSGLVSLSGRLPKETGERDELVAIAMFPLSAGELPGRVRELRRVRQRGEMSTATLGLMSKLDAGADAATISGSLKALTEISGSREARLPDHVSRNVAALFLAKERPIVPLGLEDLARCIEVKPGHVCTFGARPGGGKSAMLTTIALASALKGWNVLLLTLEMPAEEIQARLLAALSNTSLDSVTAADDPALVPAASKLASLSLWVDDLSQNPSEKRIDRLGALVDVWARARTGPTLVLVDYLQLIHPATRFQNRHEQVAAVCRELKDLAKHAGVAMIVGAQLNRQTDARADGRPRLADLKESGAIEEVSDQVVLIWRSIDPERRSHTRLLIDKNRHGPCPALARASFIGAQSLFIDATWREGE